MLGCRWRNVLVAGDDDSVDLSAPLERGDGFDSGSYGRGPALVDAGGHERVHLVQKFSGKPDGNLFCGHPLEHTSVGFDLGYTCGLRWMPTTTRVVLLASMHR